MGAARAGGARQITAIVAVGNHGRGPVGPCGRDRHVSFDAPASDGGATITKYTVTTGPDLVLVDAVTPRDAREPAE